MRKILALIIAAILLSGCATTQKSADVIPQNIIDRAAPIYYKVAGCLQITDRTELSIHPDKNPGAWTDAKNNVTLTEGLFKYDDETITFALAHELSHAKLNHVQRQRNVSLATTGVMMAVGFIVPGVGLLNHVVNPAVTNNFNKTQEADADRLASESLVRCFDISVERQVKILRSMQADIPAEGGFWSAHPSWDDRIKNIQGAP